MVPASLTWSVWPAFLGCAARSGTPLQGEAGPSARDTVRRLSGINLPVLLLVLAGVPYWGRLIALGIARAERGAGPPWVFFLEAGVILAVDLLFSVVGLRTRWWARRFLR